MRLSVLIRVLVCLATLAAPAAASAEATVRIAALSAPGAVVSFAALLHAQSDPAEKDKGCRQGARTKAFGWKLVDYGFATAKYVVGLFLIPVGLLLVCVGIVVEVVEAATCG